MMKESSDHCLMVTTGVYKTTGGIAVVDRMVIQSFLDQGYSIDIYALLESRNGISTSLGLANRIVYHTFAGNKFKFTLALWQTIMGTPYKYVFVDHVNLASILVPFRLLGLCQYIVWLHGIEVFPPKPDLEGKLGLSFAWKRLSSSGYTRNIVQRKYSKLDVVACELALDPVKFENLPSLNVSVSRIELTAIDRTQQVLGKQIVLHVGRMASGEMYKGQDSLLRAFPRILKQNPDAQLVLVGGGDDSPRLQNLAEELPTECHSHIFMPGYLPDQQLAQIYQSCFVFAMPSIGEGFGLVYLEAMSYGKPCLGGKLDATPFVVRDGITGLLVDDPRSPEQVGDALNWLLLHREEAEMMGKKGAELVHSHYLFTHFKERFWKALLEG